jgi:L-2-hydroxyglutarate oxidase
MSTADFDIAIIGGGIVGTSLARELSSRSCRILLLEKESGVGRHTSGRNSGVIHSGFNAKPGSLKAQLCVEGSRILRAFCQERSIPMEEVGTLVVAAHANEIDRLAALKKRGDENGVPGLEIISGNELRRREPNALGEGALLSPTGAIVDSLVVVQELAREAMEKGVMVAISREVEQIIERPSAVIVRTPETAYTAQLVINCAGLYSDRLAHLMGAGRDYIVAPFRGEYFAVQSAQPLVRSMLYDVPDPVFPFLGIHVTRTVTGTVLLGPNAVPALGREAYSPRQFNIRDMAELIGHKGFWNALIHNRRLFNLARRELRNSYSKTHFLKQAGQLVQGLSADMLTAETRVGIRPQLINSKGQLVDDLVIETTPRSVHLLNVVSPGMTSALAFARWVSQRIDGQLRWSMNAEEKVA